jgi:hypothetical protein
MAPSFDEKVYYFKIDWAEYNETSLSSETFWLSLPQIQVRDRDYLKVNANVTVTASACSLGDNCNQYLTLTVESADLKVEEPKNLGITNSCSNKSCAGKMILNPIWPRPGQFPST